MRWTAFILAQALTVTAAAQEVEFETSDPETDFQAVRVRSDLPLYTSAWVEFWPRSFHREQYFGCESRVEPGDWLFTPNRNDAFGASGWTRIWLNGVIHCSAGFRYAETKESLSETDEFETEGSEVGFFVKLGEVERAGSIVELWAIQEGFYPGSKYSLWAREPADGIVDSFVALQSRCPAGAMRELEGGLGIFRTDYCAINSQEDLLALAVEMLDYQPLGTLTRVGNSDWVAPPEAEEQDAEPEPEPEPEDGSWLLERLTSTPQ